MSESEQLENQKKEIEALHKQADGLGKENESLKKKLDELIKSSEDLSSYQVFIEARDLFVKWIAMFVVLIGLSGFASWQNFYKFVSDEAKDQVLKRVDDNILPKVENDILPKVESEVLKKADIRIDEVITKFEKKLEAQREQNLVIKNKLEVEIDNIASKTQVVEDRRYYVKVSSYKDYKLLKNGFLRDSKKNLGSKYDARICPPKSQQENRYAIILSLKGKEPLVSLPEANALVEMAKKDKFPEGIHAIRESSAFFDGSKCELL